MKFNPEGKPNTGSHELPPIDEGEKVIEGVIAEYYEKIMALNEQLISATSAAEKDAIKAEIEALQAEMNKGSDVLTEGKMYPKNEGKIHEIDDDGKMAA